jgi:acetoin utilization deacetylase AcuC-like enzyme
MNNVALIYNPIFLDHDTGVSHPENANRLRSILKHSEDLPLMHLEPNEASERMVQLVHPFDHIDTIRYASAQASYIDGDTKTSRDSFEAALTAVGGGIQAIDAIEEGSVDSAFVAARPPGHHATATQAMGFCLFNTIAITARYAQELGYEKVLIIDFDVHHGNGTQDIFYDDPTVFYMSTHQHPAYPGTGLERERGRGEGEGYTLNFPLFAGSDDADILEVYEEALPEVIKSFSPDIVLVSAGYDLHESDPLASLSVTTEGIREIVRLIHTSTSVPKAYFLEGGYNIEALGQSVRATLEVMLEN